MALHVATKVVIKRLKNGSVKRYKYYQLVRSYHRKRQVRTKYICYLGKEPSLSQQKAMEVGLTSKELERVEGLNVLANQKPAPDEVLANSNPESLREVLANQNKEAEEEEHDPFVPPEKRPTKAVCPRCGREFIITWFERELGHYLCQRCRAEIVNRGERSSWPGY